MALRRVCPNAPPHLVRKPHVEGGLASHDRVKGGGAAVPEDGFLAEHVAGQKAAVKRTVGVALLLAAGERPPKELGRAG
jgi:hypothetical protein